MTGRVPASRQPPGRPLCRWLCLLVLSLAFPAASASAAGEALRVGTSGDYPPWSVETTPGEYEGFSVALARRYAKDRKLSLQFVRFRWPRLGADLEADRFDVAMSGITVRPERSYAGIFTVPVAETRAIVLVKKDTWTELEQLDRERIRIGVNAGGHLERVAAQHFPRATRVAIPHNASVPIALVDDAVQAIVTDSTEAPIWREQHPDLIPLEPLSLDRKALLVNRRRPDLAADLDEWLLDRERDGTLAALRREHLGEGPWRAVAEPLPALLAALDERLSLMPTVAVVKRATGVPLEVPEREDLVIEAAAEAMLEAASRRDAVAPSFLLIRRFIRVQLEAAKQVQRDTVMDPEFAPEGGLPDLDEDLRPALLQIGGRVARLVVRLPPLEPLAVHQAAAEALRAPALSRSSIREIAEAIALIAPRAE